MILPENITLSERIPSFLPMVFVPGLLCDAAIWNTMVQAFSGSHATSISDLTPDDSILGVVERLLKDAPHSLIMIGVSWSVMLSRKYRIFLQKSSFYQCGHLPPIEQPYRTVRVIQTWLNSVTVDG